MASSMNNLGRLALSAISATFDLRACLGRRANVAIRVPLGRLACFHRRIPTRSRILIFAAQHCQSTFGLGVSASDKQCVHSSQWRNIRTMERRIGDRSYPEKVTEACNRGLVAIRDSKCWYLVLSCVQYRIDGGLQTTPKADRNQQVLGTEQADLLMNVSGRCDWSLGVIAQRCQTVCKQIGQPCREIHS